MRLTDTLTGRIRDLEPREPGKVSIYACGPTVYDVPHLGHARTALTYDVLVRYLRWRGQEVTLVSNITDIDDNIINRAAETGTTEPELAPSPPRTRPRAPDRNRTCGLPLRRRSLYPTELRGRDRRRA